PHTPALHSFPTRRSSDLTSAQTPPTPTLVPRPRITTGGVGTPSALDWQTRYDQAAGKRSSGKTKAWIGLALGGAGVPLWILGNRSEEHTSELQSLAYLVC